MDRTSAELLIKCYRQFGEWFNEATHITLSLRDQEAGKRIRKALAEMQFIIQDAIVVPVQNSCPDLVREDE